MTPFTLQPPQPNAEIMGLLDAGKLREWLLQQPADRVFGTFGTNCAVSAYLQDKLGGRPLSVSTVDVIEPKKILEHEIDYRTPLPPSLSNFIRATLTRHGCPGTFTVKQALEALS